MAIQQVVRVFIELQGDGVSKTFVYALANLYQEVAIGTVPFGTTGIVPSSVVVNNPPIPVTSATIDANGNITITFAVALANTAQIFELDLIYNSGAAVSSSPTQAQNVSAVNIPFGPNGRSLIVEGFNSGVAVPVSASDGNIFVRQTNAANLNATVVGTVSFTGTSFTNTGSPAVSSLNVYNEGGTVSIIGTVAVTQSTSPWVVAVEGHAGGVFDAATGASVPANALQVGGSDGTNLQPLSVTVKGTQGARGLAVQELKDAGRVYVTFVLDAIAGVTTEALTSMAINKGGTASSATSYTVTAGKTFRVQSMTACISSSSGTNSARVRLRSAGTVSATSPILCTLQAGASSGAVGDTTQVVPDGLEIAAGQQFGLSQIASGTSAIVTCCVIGYEY